MIRTALQIALLFLFAIPTLPAQQQGQQGQQQGQQDKQQKEQPDQKTDQKADQNSESSPQESSSKKPHAAGDKDTRDEPPPVSSDADKTNTNYNPFPAQQDVEIGTFYLHKGDVDAAI